MSTNGPQRVVFLCTANRIRSVFALRASQQLGLRPHWLAQIPLISRGVAAQPDLPAMAPAITAARKLGIDLNHHRSRPLAATELDGAWLLAMTRDHLAVVDQPAAWTAQRLDPNRDIPDPIGLEHETYISCFETILSALQQWSQSAPPAVPAPS